MLQRSPITVRDGSVALAAVAIGAACLVVAMRLPSGWFPHDDGQLGQCAERILRGELPHRDFDEMYTGGLSYLNALSFRLFGVRSESMRWMLGLFFVPFIATVYWLTRRVTPAAAAAGVTMLCACVSLPVYSAPMPSWYNLFFATFGVAALLRHVDSGRTRWLFVAGLCGGVSMLFKITGLYLVAVGLLAIAFGSQQQDARCLEDTGSLSQRSVLLSGLFTVAVGLFGALGLFFLRGGEALMSGLHYTLPLIAIAAFLIWNEWRCAANPATSRMGSLLRQAAPFLCGVALPWIGWVGFYGANGALEDLYEGLFVLPRQRLAGGEFPLPDASLFLAVIPLGWLLILGLRDEEDDDRKMAAGLLAILGLLLAVSHTKAGFLVPFHALRNLTPVVVGVGLWMLVGRFRTQLSPLRQRELFVMCSAALLTSLVQYPFAYGVYFFYAAPLVVLAVLYIVSSQPRAPRLAHSVVLGFFVLFAVLRLNSADTHANVTPDSAAAASRMELPRCSLVVPADEAAAYEELVREIQSRTDEGDAIYALPDCPEAYFLSGRRNPTRVIYEFFRPELFEHPETLLRQLDAANVNLVVLNREPSFSLISPHVEQTLERAFPYTRDIFPAASGQKRRTRFRLLWRERPARPLSVARSQLQRTTNNGPRTTDR